VPSLKQIAVLRLLKQLSEVYSTMKVGALAELVPFATFSEVEAIIVDAVKYDYLQVRGAPLLLGSCFGGLCRGCAGAAGAWRVGWRPACERTLGRQPSGLAAHHPPAAGAARPQVHIDHRNGTLHFGSQQLESDRVRGHLTTLAKRLTKAASMVRRPPPACHLRLLLQPLAQPLGRCCHRPLLPPAAFPARPPRSRRGGAATATAPAARLHSSPADAHLPPPPRAAADGRGARRGQGVAPRRAGAGLPGQPGEGAQARAGAQGARRRACL
jgi:hypothetical protein